MRQLFILCLLFVASGLSQEVNDSEPTTESWYTYWGLGYAAISYPSELQEVIDFLKDQPNVTNTPLYVDMIGFYWHLTHETIAGIIVSGAGDRYEVKGEDMQINQYLYSASAMHFFGESFGSGPFVRADLGIAANVLTSSFSSSAGSERGIGFLAGGGWSFDFGGTRLLLNVNYAFRRVEEENYSILGLSVGGLF